MSSNLLPTVAALLKLEEVLNLPLDDLEGKTVRVTGSLLTYDAKKCHATLGAPNLKSSLGVSTNLVEPFNGKTGSLYQVIGDVDCLSDVHLRLVKATAVRCVDGLDLAEYYQALDGQREYLQQRTKPLQQAKDS